MHDSNLVQLDEIKNLTVNFISFLPNKNILNFFQTDSLLNNTLEWVIVERRYGIDFAIKKDLLHIILCIVHMRLKKCL